MLYEVITAYGVKVAEILHNAGTVGVKGEIDEAVDIFNLFAVT